MDSIVSVIIPSYNGAKKLPSVLAALENQNRDDFEVIVVLDGSTDESIKVLESGKWNLNLKIHYQENKGRAGARNAGAAIAQGNYFIFYDDDVVPQPDSVRKHVQGLQIYDITVGQPLEPENSTTEYGKFKAWLSRFWLEDMGNDPIELYPENIFLTAANMGIRAEAFKNLNGFDERLSDAEDFDLAIRAYYKGMRILYHPGNIVTHYGFETLSAYIQRQREYRVAHQELIILRQNEDKLKLYQKYNIQKTRMKKSIYFWIPGCTPRWIDKGYFKFLPLKYRFKIYPRVISALSIYYPDRKL